MDGGGNFSKLHAHFFYQGDLIINRMLGLEVPKFELNVVQERSFGKFMANTVGSLGDKAHDRSPCSLMHINHDIIAVCKKSVIKPKLVQPGFFFKT